jgi:hypothetical protein
VGKQMRAADIINSALGHMQDRAATYDKPEGERSMGATVDAFTAVTGVSMTEEQGWLFMALLKAVRSQQGAYRADSYEDGAAYFALAGEAAARDRLITSSMPIHPAWVDVNYVDPADVDIASAIDDDSPRSQAIGQNGNTGEHYDVAGAPDWAAAPWWANWLAQDEDGEWFWFGGLPTAGIDSWRDDDEESEIIAAGVGFENKNWRDTLQQRPAI